MGEDLSPKEKGMQHRTPAVSHSEDGPGAEVMGLSRKGRAYGAAGAVSERAESGRSARAQAGARRQRGRRWGGPPRELILPDGVRVLLRPFYLVVRQNGLKTLKNIYCESVSQCVVRRQLVVLVARRSSEA